MGKDCMGAKPGVFELLPDGQDLAGQPLPDDHVASAAAEPARTSTSVTDFYHRAWGETQGAQPGTGAGSSLKGCDPDASSGRISGDGDRGHDNFSSH